jgi:membrane glycosyltransferase
MVQTKKPHVSRNLPWCWMIKEVVPVVKRDYMHFFLSVFFLVMFLAQISYNFCTILTTFLRLTIRYLSPTYKKIDSMVDHKKIKKIKKKIKKNKKNSQFFYLK